jgi:hypothetical protein
MRVIADANYVTDHPSLIAFRPIESGEALIRCLVATLAYSEKFRVPSKLRELTEGIEKRLRYEIRAAQDAGFAEQTLSRVHTEGHA